ncbi:MAG: hypothetical protein JRG94_16390, partial [Deltaproteobacteria bacterium]|nr:hypothetical protein [Deltaproteobacteria bacterium]
MKTCTLRPLLVSLAIMLGSAAPAAAADMTRWDDYLDFAYIYSSADASTLAQRLAGYGKEAGVSLEDYILGSFEVPAEAGLEEADQRRKAIAYLLQYLAGRDTDALDASVEAIEVFEGQLGRHENLYWYRYIMAHRSLESGNP